MKEWIKREREEVRDRKVKECRKLLKGEGKMRRDVLGLLRRGDRILRFGVFFEA